MKKITTLIICLIMMMGVAVNASAPEFDDTARYLINTVDNPTVSSIGGEWAVIGLARCGLDIDNEYFERYYANVQNYVKSKDGVIHSRKNTEYSRVIIALTAIGKNPEDVAGYNLVTPLLDYDQTIWQGLNGPIWAIIALDSGNYGTQEIRDKYIAKILESEKPNGGWSLSEPEQNADADVTAMALIALSNYRDRPDVKPAVERGVNVLSEMQNTNGGYTAYNTETSESTAQVLTALSSLGISYNDARFIKNGKNLIDNLYSFKNKDGSFSHTDEINIMATEQCFYALVSAKRLEENKTSLFDMSDTVKKEFSDTIGLPDKILAVHARERMYDITFSDTYGGRYENEINELAAYGVISGKAEGIFEPESNMTRAEFSTIMVNALCLDKIENDVFSDVTANDWYFESVNTAYSYNIVKGISDTVFNPYGVITKQEAAVMVARASTLCGIDTGMDDTSIRNTLSAFADYMNTAEWAREAMSFCYKTDILDSSEIEINADSVVTRAEIAHMTYTMLKNANLIK